MPISANERLLPSLARRNVATRVESVWNASTSMSNMSFMCSSNDGGMPGCVSTRGSGVTRRRGREQACEHRPRIRLGRDRRRGRAPREVELVGAGVARVAIAALADRVAGQLERGEPRQVADLPGRDLVDGDSGVDVGAGGLLDAHAGQERPAGAGVVAGAVGAGGGVLVVQASEDLDLVLHLLQ